MFMDNFELPISYNGKEYLFATKVIKQAYTERFEVSINGHAIIFEPDEEGKYRAILNEKESDGHELGDTGLLKEIAEAIQFIAT